MAHSHQTFLNRAALYNYHLKLYEQYFKKVLPICEQHCPGVSALLALVYIDQDLYHLFDRNEDYSTDISFVMAPIVHPKRLGPHQSRTQIHILTLCMSSGLHPLLASLLAPQVPSICTEVALSCLHYLRSGGHCVDSLKSLKPLVKSTYFKKLKLRPWLSRLRRIQHRHVIGHRVGIKQDLRVSWDDALVKTRFGSRVLASGWISKSQVPCQFFDYRTKYASNYDLWYTYRYALQTLPIFLEKASPNSQLATLAVGCIFNIFCTAYPRETRKARKAIARYRSRCRVLKELPLRTGVVGDGINDPMDVDSYYY